MVIISNNSLQEKCQQVALENTPCGLKIEYSDKLDFNVQIKWREGEMMYYCDPSPVIMPRPSDPTSLYIFLVGTLYAIQLTMEGFDNDYSLSRRLFLADKMAKKILSEASIDISQQAEEWFKRKIAETEVVVIPASPQRTQAIESDIANNDLF